MVFVSVKFAVRFMSANQKNKISKMLDLHVQQLLACKLCPAMHKPVVSGGAVLSPVMLVGQAPGDKEPLLGRPFAWTAGKTLFRWFNEAAGMSETDVSFVDLHGGGLPVFSW